jgi:hypothetical protein
VLLFQFPGRILLPPAEVVAFVSDRQSAAMHSLVGFLFPVVSLCTLLAQQTRHSEPSTTRRPSSSQSSYYFPSYIYFSQNKHCSDMQNMNPVLIYC